MVRSEQSKEYHRGYVREKSQLGREALQVVNDIADKFKNIDFSKLKNSAKQNTETEINRAETTFSPNISNLNPEQSRKVTLAVAGILFTFVVIYWLFRDKIPAFARGNNITIQRE